MDTAISKENIYYEAVKATRDSQRKFDYFFLGVCLALVSLSVQTHETTSPNSHIYLLIISWTLLIVSFLSGMYRQEAINTFLRIEADLMPEQEILDRFNQYKTLDQTIIKPDGQEWTSDEIDEVRLKKKIAIERANTLMGKKADRGLWAYRFQKWSFVMAIIFYMLFKIINSI